MKILVTLLIISLVGIIFSFTGCDEEDLIPATPAITNISADTASVGTVITITGENFTSDTSELSVTIGNIPVSPTSISETQIVFVVPQGITEGENTIMIAITGRTDVARSSIFIEPTVVGTWSVSEVTGGVTVNGVPYKDYLVDSLSMEQDTADKYYDDMMDEMQMSGTIDFNSDGTYTANFDDDDPENGTWTLSDDKKTLTVIETGDDDVTVLTVQSLTSTTMVVVMSNTEEDDDWNQDGHNEEMEMTMTMTFAIQL